VTLASRGLRPRCERSQFTTSPLHRRFSGVDVTQSTQPFKQVADEIRVAHRIVLTAIVGTAAEQPLAKG
jgi:hypothetical protein